MTTPDSPPDLRRTCPTCKKPVDPGFKFCQACGTRIPALFTCSKCGTQFVHPMKYCELCGARLIPGETTEPETVVVRKKDEVPEPGTEELPEPETVVVRKKDEVSAEDRQEPVGEGVPEPEEEESPGPGTDELAGPDEGEPEPDEGAGEGEEAPEPAAEEPEELSVEAIFKPKKKRKPGRPARETREPVAEEPEEEEVPEPAVPRKSRHPSPEIREPDTAELLAKYGPDSDDEVKKPVAGWRSWFRRREQPKNADEALFLSDEKPARARPRKNLMLRVLGAGMMAAAVLAAIVIFGLPMLPGLIGAIGSPAVQETPVPEPTMTETATLTLAPTTASGALVPKPTQTIPTDQKYYFQVQKNPVTYRVSVIFIGSSGSGITRADIKVTHADGSVSTGIILPLKGITELALNGSNTADRVEIIATVSSGATYRVYDSLVA